MPKKPKVNKPKLPEIRKKAEYDLFYTWRCLPALWRGKPAEFLERLGITDPEHLELLTIKTNLEFAARYGVDKDTLSTWSKRFNSDPEVMEKIRTWATKMTPAIYEAFGRAMVRRPKGQDVLVWQKTVNNFVEKSKVDTTVTLTINEILDAAENRPKTTGQKMEAKSPLQDSQ